MISSSRWTCGGALVHLLIAGGLGVAVLGGCSESLQENHGPVSRDQDQAVQMAQDQPPTAKTLFSLAAILAAQGKDPQCEFVLLRCIHQYPQYRPAYNKLAELFMHQGRVREAASVLSEALAIQPTDPVLLNNLGMCLLIAREYEKALDCFTQAAGERPANTKYRVNMAVALGLLGRHDESLALLRQTLPEPQAVHNDAVLRKADQKVTLSSGPAQG